MNADVNALELLLVILVELLFGIGFNFLVAWLHRHQIWHVTTSVIVGVVMTLLIPSAAWFDEGMPFWKAVGMLAMCFAASGLPMVAGSTWRTVQRKDDKKRRPWPNAAMQARDDVVMELSAMAHEIAGKAKEKELAVSDLPDYVNRLHGVIGTLKSV